MSIEAPIPTVARLCPATKTEDCAYLVKQVYCKGMYIFQQVVSSPAVPFYPVGNGEGLRLAKDRMDEKNVYYMNPSFDT